MSQSECVHVAYFPYTEDKRFAFVGKEEKRLLVRETLHVKQYLKIQADVQIKYWISRMTNTKHKTRTSLT